MGISRKLWLLVAVAIVSVLATAAPVFAEAGTSTWATPTGGNSPHGGYATTTNKCVVCHAAHASTGDLGAAMLLRESPAGACNYCHIDVMAGVKHVYESNDANYSGTDYNNAHNAPDVTCTKCHQVHAAASLMTDNQYLTTKLLQKSTADPEAGFPRDQALDSTNTAMTKFCAGCHSDYATNMVYYKGIVTATGLPSSAAAGHVMKSYTTTYTVNGTGMQIAWADSTQCSSCHAAGFQTSAWPHYVSGAARFLTSGGNIASATVGAAEATDDGVCLRCHRGTNSFSGVGLDF